MTPTLIFFTIPLALITAILALTALDIPQRIYQHIRFRIFLRNLKKDIDGELK